MHLKENVSPSYTFQQETENMDLNKLVLNGRFHLLTDSPLHDSSYFFIRKQI